MTRLLLILTSALVLGSHALAAVPTRDAAILERRAQESGHKTELKTILLDHKKKRRGSTAL